MPPISESGGARPPLPPLFRRLCSDLSVVAVTADGASHNRHFFHLCCFSEDGKKSPIPFVTKNPFAERDVYLFCDPPHLIKTARNCFSNSFAYKMSQELKVEVKKFRLCEAPSAVAATTGRSLSSRHSMTFQTIGKSL